MSNTMNTETTTHRTIEVVTVTLNPAIDQTVTIPNFAAGKVNRVQHSQSDPGGKGVNVASFLVDYGHAVAVTGFLGRENLGLFEVFFAQKRIEDDFVRIAGQTRVGIKIADPVQNQTTDINFPGQAPTPADIDALFQRLEALDGEWFVLAGSIPPGVDSTIYRDLVTALKARGRNVVLDTSGDGLRYALEAVPQIVKPNIHELEEILGAPLTTQAAMIEAVRTLLARGIQLVVVSMGSEGACFVTEQAMVTARPPRVEVKSTVGAGDAMVAGIVAGQLRQVPLATCARLATAFSLDAISHIGSGLSSQAAIEAFMNRVTVEEQRM
jgi:1-phosphofructokinase